MAVKSDVPQPTDLDLRPFTAGRQQVSGTFQYGISFYTATEESGIYIPRMTASITYGQRVRLTIPIGGPGVVGRRIYRTGQFTGHGLGLKFLSEIADNSRTEFVDEFLGGNEC